MHLSSRQQQIMSILQHSGQITVQELCNVLFFSPSTIRRELERLERFGLLNRTHGGAVIRNSWNNGVPILIREALETESKIEIAKTAAQYIEDGDRVFIDSSTTALPIVSFLDGKSDLTVFTNGLQLANELLKYPKIKAFCTGGQLIDTSQSFVGPQVLRSLEYYYADKLFFSSNSFSLSSGVTDNSEAETELKRQMVLHSKKAFYLADKTKIGITSTYKICSPAEIYMLITNADAESFSASDSLPFKLTLT